MNNYKNKFGCHTPAATERMAQLLTDNGIAFEDVSWHNDELDRLEIPFDDSFDLMIWIGDEDHEEEYRTNTIWKAHKVDCDLDTNDVFTSASMEEVVEKVKQLLAAR